MRIHILILVTIFISGCSNVQPSSQEESALQQTNTMPICKKIARHKSVFKRCQSVTPSE